VINTFFGKEGVCPSVPVGRVLLLILVSLLIESEWNAQNQSLWLCPG